mgnify:CR=1 FL=1
MRSASSRTTLCGAVPSAFACRARSFTRMSQSLQPGKPLSRFRTIGRGWPSRPRRPRVIGSTSSSTRDQVVAERGQGSLSGSTPSSSPPARGRFSRVVATDSTEVKPPRDRAAESFRFVAWDRLCSGAEEGGCCMLSPREEGSAGAISGGGGGGSARCRWSGASMRMPRAWRSGVGFKAIYLSGGGVAAGSLGVPDLGITTLDDVLTDVRRITSVTRASAPRRRRHRVRRRVQHRADGPVADRRGRRRHAHRGSGAGQALRTPAGQGDRRQGGDGRPHQGGGGRADRRRVRRHGPHRRPGGGGSRPRSTAPSPAWRPAPT